MNSTYINAAENDGPPNPTLHVGVTVYFIVVTIIGLLFTNVYIGLIASLYDQGVKSAHQLHQHVRAGYTIRLMLVQWTFGWLGKRTTDRSDDHDVNTVDGSDSQPGIDHGCWLAFDKSCLLDEQDEDSKLQDVQDRILNLQHWSKQLVKLTATSVS